MASSYTFTLYLALRDDLTQVELDTLDYLFNAREAPPEQWPAHPFFESGRVPGRLGSAGGSFPRGAYVSACWHSSDHPGMFSGVHFTCPNLKLEWFTEYQLHMAKWLATLSSSRGYVGAFTSQDDGEGLPWLFYVYDGRLYMHFAEPGIALSAADTGEAYPWP